MIDKAWVIVANGAKARLFRVENNELLQEEEGLIHPKAHLKELDMVTDKPGRSFDRFGGGRHHLSGASPKEQEAVLFAKSINQHLEKGVEKGEIKQIYLIASPSFLGQINKQMHPNVKKAVQQEVPKDLTQKKPEEIRKNLPLVL